MSSSVISYGAAMKIWWRCPGLNGGPAAYESAALPTELHRHMIDFTEELTPEATHRILRVSTPCPP